MLRNRSALAGWESWAYGLGIRICKGYTGVLAVSRCSVLGLEFVVWAGRICFGFRVHPVRGEVGQPRTVDFEPTTPECLCQTLNPEP